METKKRRLETARISESGQVTIPETVRKRLNAMPGKRITFIIEDDMIRVVNPAQCAMEELQKKLEGEAEKIGLTSEASIVSLINEIREEYEGAY